MLDTNQTSRHEIPGKKKEKSAIISRMQSTEEERKKEHLPEITPATKKNKPLPVLPISQNEREEMSYPGVHFIRKDLKERPTG